MEQRQEDRRSGRSAEKEMWREERVGGRKLSFPCLTFSRSNELSQTHSTHSLSENPTEDEDEDEEEEEEEESFKLKASSKCRRKYIMSL